VSDYTPGPWKAVPEDCDSGQKWFDIWSDEHGSVAHVSEGARPDENLKRFRADARLIAAAPELGEALVLFVSQDCESYGCTHFESREYASADNCDLFTARAALRKAGLLEEE